MKKEYIPTKKFFIETKIWVDVDIVALFSELELLTFIVTGGSVGIGMIGAVVVVLELEAITPPLSVTTQYPLSSAHDILPART